jgi:hypothetical protein
MIMRSRRKILFLLLLLSLTVSGLTAGCGGRASHEAEHELAMAPLAEMPVEVQRAPVVVQQAYQFAVANPDVLQQLPCYCGCGPIGHASNYACYVAGADSNGALIYDPHALGCSICVDITQDAMRLLPQGKTVPEIRAYVDSTYARYGPSNMP